MAITAYDVYTTATEDGSGYGSVVTGDDTHADGFGDGYRVWRGRDSGSKIRLQVVVGSGDTLKLYGKYLAADAWIEMASYTATAIVEVSPIPIWVIQRTAGSSNDSVVTWAA